MVGDDELTAWQPRIVVFDRDGRVIVFGSDEQATGWIEHYDVESNEYDAFRPDGQLLRLVVGSSDEVIVNACGEWDAAGLRERLIKAPEVFARGLDSRDVPDTLNALLEPPPRRKGRRWLI